jgi:hypothetical protein
MRGTMFVVDLPGPVAPAQLAELDTALRGFAVRVREARTGSWDLDVEPGDDRPPRRFTVNIAGPGFGDEGVFEAAHAEDPDLAALIGFTPTHDVVVTANGGSGDLTDRTDRVLLAELAATVQSVVGGVIDIVLSQRVLNVVRDLPGVVAVAEELEDLPRLYCTAEFLRTWVTAPQFADYTLGTFPHRVSW